jgi:signal transduction histidine kinase
LKRAIEASELERRRIASDLHDGVVQNLAGVSYTLSATAEGFEQRRPAENVEMVRHAATEVRHSIRELRTLLVDIYPPTLRRAGLEAALSDLVAPLKAREVETELEVQPEMNLPPEGEPLLYRAAQEALRNAASHADPRHVRVAAERQNGRAMLSVEDDGRGFDPAVVLADGTGRHFGLRILRDLARDAGGELTVDSQPGQGTRVRIEIPAA